MSNNLNIAIIGGAGAIGKALTQQASLLYPEATIHAFSRHHGEETTSNTKIINHTIDYTNEASLDSSASVASHNAPLDMVIVATGILHDEGISPEKSLRDLSEEKFHRLFTANTIVPALIAKHFLPKLTRDNRSIFAALSARVGSISDNQLGGWYAYRASKTALNMIIKNAAIEIGRRNHHAIIVGLHPGTVDSDLSKPFQSQVAREKLFTPQFSATKMLEVLEHLTPKHSGKCFAWDGSEVKP